MRRTHSEMWLHGFGVAVASIARQGYDSNAVSAIEDNGLSLNDFEGIDMMDFDMRQLRRIFKYRASKRRGGK